MSLRFNTLHYRTLHYTPVHYITLHYNSSTLNYIKLHYTTLHYIEWRCNTDRHVCQAAPFLLPTTLTGFMLHYGFDKNRRQIKLEGCKDWTRRWDCKQIKRKSKWPIPAYPTLQVMFARPLHFCCQQLSQASCSTTGSTKIEGKSSLKDARTGHDDEIASKSSENRSGLSNSAPRVAWSLLVIRLTQKRWWSGSKFQDKFSFVLGQVRKEDLAHDILQVVFQGPARLPAPAP